MSEFRYEKSSRVGNARPIILAEKVPWQNTVPESNH